MATYLFDENLVAFTPENSDAPALLLARRSAGGGWDTYKILVNAEGRWLVYREENSSWRPVAKGRTEVDLQGTVNDAGDTDLGFGAGYASAGSCWAANPRRARSSAHTSATTTRRR